MLLLRIHVITSVSSYFADYITAIDVHLYIYLFYQQQETCTFHTEVYSISDYFTSCGCV